MVMDHEMGAMRAWVECPICGVQSYEFAYFNQYMKLLGHDQTHCRCKLNKHQEERLWAAAQGKLSKAWTDYHTAEDYG